MDKLGCDPAVTALMRHLYADMKIYFAAHGSMALDSEDTRDVNSIMSRNEFIPTSHEVQHLRVPGPNGTILGANSM